MKNTLKRIVSLGLSAVLATSMLGAPAFAVEGDEEQVPASSEEHPLTADEGAVAPEGEEAPDASDPSAQDEEQQDQEYVIEGIDTDLYSEGTLLTQPEEQSARARVNQNKVNVVIYDDKPFKTGSTTFQVSLSGHGSVQTKTYSQNGSLRGVAAFSGIEPGSYTLTINAPRYHEYTQPLNVLEDGSWTYNVKVHTFLYSANNPDSHPGIIYYGDVNDDGSIADDDVDALISSIAAADYVESCDLAQSGEVSLTDLQILSVAYGSDPVTATEDKSLYLMQDVEGTIEGNLPNVSISENAVIDSSGSFSSFDEVIGNADASQSLKLASDAAISSSNPIEIVLNNLDKRLSSPVEAMYITPPAVLDDGNGSSAGDGIHDNAIEGGLVVVEYVDDSGKDQRIELPFGKQEPIAAVSMLAQFVGLAPQVAYAASASAYLDANGTIVVDFGNQIAIKKVTLKVTKTHKPSDNFLAEISSVEFLNNMENRIEEPSTDVPEGLSGVPGDKQFTLSWSPAENVTGYEISIEAAGKQCIKSTTSTTITVTSLGGSDKIVNGTAYTIKVRSTNSSWRSAWSEPITVTPEATKAPDRPDNVSATGGYKCIIVKWKKMEDTDSYTVFYRKKTDANNGSWSQIADITSNSVTIDNLEDLTEYQVYVKGKNSIGESQPSDTAVAQTISISPAKMPSYKLINTKDADGHYLNKIASVRVQSAKMNESPLDEGANTAFGIFDDDFTSFASKADWDLGDAYHRGQDGVIIEFTEPVTIGFISFAASQQNIQYSSMSLMARDDAGAMQQLRGVTFNNINDGSGRQYTLVGVEGGVTTDRIILGMSRYVRYIDIAEMRIHGYDSIAADINALYSDDFHIKLVDGVDTARLDALQARLDAPDETSGEYYPYRKSAQLELDFARQLLEDENAGLGEVVTLHSDLNDAADSAKNLGISGLNAWQPLGYVVPAGDSITAYIASSKGSGGQSKVQLYIGQQYAESNNAPTYGGTFPVGRKVYTVSATNSKDCERGGQLYAKYSGSDASETWAVRIMGATAIPTIDVYGDADEASRIEKAKTYIQKLDAHVSELNKASSDESEHDRLHNVYSEGNDSVDYDFSTTECILNATELMTDHMLYSVPATKVLGNIGTSGTLDDRARRLLRSLEGTDQMFEVFYQHKGMIEPQYGAKATNTTPTRHLNIRCMRMFAGAFMYAAGNHIGVGYNESANFMMLAPISDEATAPGGQRSTLSDGRFFGWGSAHEIGHNINDGRYAVAEITNNYFAQICKMINEGTTRWSYDSVYDKVTSGSVGRSGSVAVQLAMYWQLRLGYDNNEVYTLYKDIDSLLANRFFARVDSYARAAGDAPIPEGGIPLSTNAGESQNIIRLASAAAQKDLSLFFTRWGLVPNAETTAFVSQYPAEQRALQYITDEYVAWARSNPNAAKVLGADALNATISSSDSIVDIRMSAADPNAIGSLVGYEIIRNHYENGEVKSDIAGFAKAASDGSAAFKDDAKYLGNRTVFYTIKAVDKFMNYSNEYTTDTIKLDGTGLYATDSWTASTNMESSQDAIFEEPSEEPSDDDYICPDEGKADLVPAIEGSLSGTATDPYIGRTANGDDPYVLVDMKSVNAITKIRYTPQDSSKAITDYKVSVSNDGISFQEIAEGTFELDSDGNAEIFFYGDDEKWIVTENARFVRLTAVGQGNKDLAIQHIGIYGPSGDNVDMLSVDGIPVIGRLAEDFVYDQSDPETYVIKAGSIVFTGSYTGNPSYNVVVLYDENGKIVGAPAGYENDEEYSVSNQIVLADVPSDEDAKLGKTNDGRWIYWIDSTTQLPAKVRAELYRVDNALTNEGQRMTSDSLFQTVQSFESLPSITFKSKTSE